MSLNLLLMASRLIAVQALMRPGPLNTGQNIVWKVVGETLLPGYSDEM